MTLFLERPRCQVMVIDMQERLMQAMAPARKEEFARSVETLVLGAGVLSVPVVASEQYPRGLGPTVPALVAALGEVPRLEKLHFSCWREPALHEVLTCSERNTVILCGMEAHVCVLQTAFDLLGAGYEVVVATDAVCSRRDEDRAAALSALGAAGAVLYPVETILFMLLEKAGTEEFRKIAPLVK